jgi:hypothetical protein
MMEMLVQRIPAILLVDVFTLLFLVMMMMNVPLTRVIMSWDVFPKTKFVMITTTVHKTLAILM